MTSFLSESLPGEVSPLAKTIFDAVILMEENSFRTGCGRRRKKEEEGGRERARERREEELVRNRSQA